MKKLYYVIVLAASMLLMGCAPFKRDKPEVLTVYETKIVLLEPPAKFYMHIDLIAPPDRAAYKQMTCEAKENVLTDLYIKQNKQLATANQNSKDLNDWIVKQKALQQADKDKKK